MSKHLVIFIVVFLVFSCNNQPKKEKAIDWNNEKSTQMNKQFSAEEEVEINLYLARKPQWKMQKTGSGLRYFIYEKGTGNPAVSDDYVDIEYTITLLDGTSVYSTKSDEVEEFKVDKSEIESGIQEAFKLLREGDKAKLIIPSHLAHGLVGDMSKIPPLSTLIVDISIHKIYHQQNN
jgi:FKBP-type peptidyl-prolyl cis-trans isomerase FkpA